MGARRHNALGLGASVALHCAALAAAFAFGSGWWGTAQTIVGTESLAVWPVVWVENESQVREVPEPLPESIQELAQTQAPLPAPAKAQSSARIEPPKAATESSAAGSPAHTVAPEPPEASASSAEWKSEPNQLDSREASSAAGAAPDELALAVASPALVSSATIGWSIEVRIPPIYPLGARRRGAEGDVLLRAEIGADGVPTVVTVLRSSGHAELDFAARSAVEKWRFRAPIGSGVEIPIVFRLDAR